MENENMNQQEQSQEQNSPVQMVGVSDVQKYIENQSKEFELAELEYKAGKKDKFTLYGKIAEIMGDLGRIPKSGRNTSQGYDYVTESDITGAVRPLMAKQKIVMIPSIRNYKVEELPTKYSKLNMGTIEIKWTIIDGESAEQVSFSMIGKGTDTGEKDIYKAITGNKKYALITLFMIDSGDDPERDDGNDNKSNQNQNQGQNQKPNQKPNKNQNQKPNQNQGNNQKGDTPYNYMPQDQQNASQNGQKENKEQTSSDGNKNESGPSSGSSGEVKQPTKGDLVTRWMVLAGNEGTKAENRKKFDSWYEKKTKENWDHLSMMKALTQKLQEKNQADQKAEKDQEKPPAKTDKEDKGKQESKPNKEKPQDDGEMSLGEEQALKNGGVL